MSASSPERLIKDDAVAVSPVEPDGPGWKLIATAAIAAILALFAWITNWITGGMREQQRDHATRISKLEQSYVTRAELDLHMQRLGDAAIRMHTENREALSAIQDRLERGSHTRHDMRDEVNAIKAMLYELLEKNRHPNRGQT